MNMLVVDMPVRQEALQSAPGQWRTGDEIRQKDNAAARDRRSAQRNRVIDALIAADDNLDRLAAAPEDPAVRLCRHCEDEAVVAGQRLGRLRRSVAGQIRV